ncbi:MAG: SUMF1/EgtB/PvdO family nonheme iron enzyme [bacterium]|nr:SUMF1/EgtB/PvdO family nonheme iron enzyme [bacterium]
MQIHVTDMAGVESVDGAPAISDRVAVTFDRMAPLATPPQGTGIHVFIPEPSTALYRPRVDGGSSVYSSATIGSQASVGGDFEPRLVTRATPCADTSFSYCVTLPADVIAALGEGASPGFTVGTVIVDTEDLIGDEVGCGSDLSIYRVDFGSGASWTTRVLPWFGGTPADGEATLGGGRVPLVLVHGIKLFALCEEGIEDIAGGPGTDGTWVALLDALADPGSALPELASLRDRFDVFVAVYASGREIDANGQDLAQAMAALFPSTGGEASFLAHSMGGLVVRSAMQTHAMPLDRCVTLGTPHLGALAFLEFVPGRVGQWLLSSGAPGALDASNHTSFIDDINSDPRAAGFFARARAICGEVLPGERNLGDGFIGLRSALSSPVGVLAFEDEIRAGSAARAGTAYQPTADVIRVGLNHQTIHDDLDTLAYAAEWIRLPVSAEQLDAAALHDVAVTFTNTLGQQFVIIPSGTFAMGSGSGRQVTLSRPYYIQTTEVTNAQYRAYDADYDSGVYFGTSLDGDSQPVVIDAYADMTTFTAWLSEQDSAHTYRIPTEAEWERACRAGTTTSWSFGANGSVLDSYAWHHDNSGPTWGARPVGAKLPNPWGLYDMHGNLWEWCSDWYGALADGEFTDPEGPESATYRAVRGGAWLYYTNDSMSASRRGHVHPGQVMNWVKGFRLVCPIPSPDS